MGLESVSASEDVIEDDRNNTASHLEDSITYFCLTNHHTVILARPYAFAMQPKAILGTCTAPSPSFLSATWAVTASERTIHLRKEQSLKDWWADGDFFPLNSCPRIPSGFIRARSLCRCTSRRFDQIRLVFGQPMGLHVVQRPLRTVNESLKHWICWIPRKPRRTNVDCTCSANLPVGNNQRTGLYTLQPRYYCAKVHCTVLYTVAKFQLTRPLVGAWLKTAFME